jgi:hypothetical protein
MLANGGDKSILYFCAGMIDSTRRECGMGRLNWGMKKRNVFSTIALFLILAGKLLISEAAATTTTYNYVGQQMVQIGCTSFCSSQQLRGFVTFDFDTSNFSGSASEAKSGGLTHPGGGTLKWQIAARPLTVY